MITKEEFLNLLTIADLKNIAEKLYLNFSSKHSKRKLVKIIRESRNSAKIILDTLTVDRLKHLCKRLELTSSGNKINLIERITGKKETDISKKEIDHNYNNAIDLYRAKKFKESLPYFIKAIKSHQNNAQYYFEYSKALRKEGKITEAIKAIEEAIKKDEDNAFYYTELGFYHLKNNSLDKVISSYSTALRKNNNKDQHIQKISYERIALAYSKKRRYMKAIEQYKELIGIDSTNDNYYRWLAKAQEKEKLFKDARENYEILQKKDPKNSSLQIRIAYCLKNEEERFLIDGSNVCRSFLPTGRSASINVLLSLLSEIINGGNIFFCIFDANMRYVLRNNHEERKAEEVYVSLLKNYSKFFNEVPGGTRADSFILQISNRTGERIITNDTFKKDSSNISKKYPWITSNTKRLIKGKVMDNHIIIPDLSIGILLENNTISLFGNFKKLLNARIDSK